MNLVSFVDELVKVGAVNCLTKVGTDMVESVPGGMMSQDPTPFAERVIPDEAATRIQNGHLGSAMPVPGSLGNVVVAKKPIDRERFNRPFAERK